MSQFYETELPDIIHDDQDDGDNSQDKIISKPEKQLTKRHFKKDPKEKVKDKLWESIMKEAEDDEDEEDSSSGGESERRGEEGI